MLDVYNNLLLEVECHAKDVLKLVADVQGCWSVGANDGGVDEFVELIFINALEVDAIRCLWDGVGNIPDSDVGGGPL